MNIPSSIYRKVTQGFIIPPRTMTQMLFSAAQGAFSLFSEPNRIEFIDMLEKGTIQEGVLSQATMGPAMMLSLFHDLQNPLFKKYKFDPTEFLEGVAPALENFHNVGGELENQLQNIMLKSFEEESSSSTTTTTTDGETKENKEEEESSTITSESDSSKEEKESLIAAIRLMSISGGLSSEQESKKAVAMLEHEWMDDAQKDPESLAGQLSKMVTKELFHSHEMNAKTAFLLQSHIRNITFQEGSCRVNNVALLSARAFSFIEKEPSKDEDGLLLDGPRYEPIDDDYEVDEEGDSKSKTAVAAQLEVLYDVTQEFIVGKAPSSSSPSSSSSEQDGKEEKEDGTLESKDSSSTAGAETESKQTTIVSVATFEGWLKGGPENELRWKLALHRPAFEFPGIEQAY